jgi:hypothetical protein
MNPMRQQVLKSVQRVREGADPHKHAPFARHAMRIPEHDFYALLRLYPDLNNFSDPSARAAAWDRFERSAFAEPYRVGKLFRGVIKDGVIAR